MLEQHRELNTTQLSQKHVIHNTAKGVCPHCNHTIKSGMEFCPYCGLKLVDYCTFCGADMGKNVEICPECGASSQGYNCPVCGTLSFRAFCPQCNEPLTRVAKKTVEKAQKDPIFKRAQEVLGRIELIQDAKCSELALTNDDLDNVSKQRSAAESFSDELNTLKAELNNLLSQMTPPEDATPQQQRNYMCARKVKSTMTKQVEITKRIQIRTQECCGWICNLCGCCHHQPSECAMPELGGRWLYSEKMTEKDITEIHDETIIGTRTMFY